MSKARELAELGAVYDSGALSNRNVVINGGFQLFQRATAATAQTDAAYKTADRWLGFVSGGGAYTTQKSTGHVADTGHDTALKLDVTTADTSLGTADYYSIVQKIEAQNLQHFQYGTAAAKTLTLSFWVRATKTGTSCVTVSKNDSTQYNYVAEFTINASDTWEHKTITIEPNSDIKAASGAIVNDNGLGMQVIFILGYGSNYTGGTANAWNDSADFATTNQVNHMDSTSNDFYITGVQLELGTEATPFEHRLYGDELARCKRYFERLLVDVNSSAFALGYGEGTSQIRTPFKYETKRSNPSLAVSTAGNWEFVNGVESKTASAVTGSGLGKQFGLVFGTVSGATISRVYYARASAGEYIDLDSEL